ncbi:uncharacterized protein [Montipora foliosa]|uniref:uncharacterized protein n=1 Tax=Montipora foliosa TaxID=591990 RepID=UPI0035F2165C
MIALDKNSNTVDCDNAELCLKRLVGKLSEVEIIMADREGKTNQMRKERDAERTCNEQLKKEIMKLKNELLQERTNSAQKEKKIRELEQGKLQNEGEYVSDLDERRRVSVPVASVRKQWEAQKLLQNGYPKDLTKLLDRRSNELLQQRQHYRIFEKRFQQERERCNKLERNIECVHHLLVDLLWVHKRHHGSRSEFKCNKVLMLGKTMKNHCTSFLLFGVSLVLVTLFVFLTMEEHFNLKTFISGQ